MEAKKFWRITNTNGVEHVTWKLRGREKDGVGRCGEKEIMFLPCRISFIVKCIFLLTSKSAAILACSDVRSVGASNVTPWNPDNTILISARRQDMLKDHDQ